MALRYKKIWKLMIDHNINKTQLHKAARVSTNVIAKLGRNESVSEETLSKICAVFRCDIGYIMEFDYSEEKDGKI